MVCPGLVCCLLQLYDRNREQALFQHPDQVETLPLELPEPEMFEEECIHVARKEYEIVISTNIFVLHKCLVHSRRKLEPKNLSPPRPSNLDKRIRSGVGNQYIVLTVEHILDNAD